MVGRRFAVWVSGVGLATGLAAAVTGCSVDLEPGLPQPTGDSNHDVQITGDDVVLVRFRNLTMDEAVDVEFYLTNDPLESLPDDLFVAGHLVTASIGIAGTGIVQPRQEDIIAFPCTDNLTIGTQGGRFVDNETGEPRGVGTPRWVQEGPLGLCHAVVTFEFSGDEGDFTTTLTIRN